MKFFKKAGLAFLLIATVILIAGCFFLFDASIGTYGVIRTIGWAWEFSGVLQVVFIFTLLLSFLGYVIMYAIKARFSKKVLIFNITFLAASVICSLFLKITDSLVFVLTIG
ncbi:hypothetical protein [Flavobacterium sp.]|uniref:hypothetical protein n=1 Tax=Flavobacterium sp. TaxID=239 RepID=UPI002623E326|nr:hypothetical protein [Flavobacterium sp.]